MNRTLYRGLNTLPFFLGPLFLGIPQDSAAGQEFLKTGLIFLCVALGARLLVGELFVWSQQPERRRSPLLMAALVILALFTLISLTALRHETSPSFFFLVVAWISAMAFDVRLRHRKPPLLMLSLGLTLMAHLLAGYASVTVVTGEIIWQGFLASLVLAAPLTGLCLAEHNPHWDHRTHRAWATLMLAGPTALSLLIAFRQLEPWYLFGFSVVLPLYPYLKRPPESESALKTTSLWVIIGFVILLLFRHYSGLLALIG